MGADGALRLPLWRGTHEVPVLRYRDRMGACPGTKCLMPGGKRARNGVMAADQFGKFDIEQCLIFDAYSPVNNTQVYVWRMAEDERGARIVWGSSCQR